MSDVRAWLVENMAGVRWTVFTAKTAEVAIERGLRVTRLIAAPPEGTPTYAELVAALTDCVEAQEQGGFLSRANAHRSGSALLSRLPTDAGE